MIKHQLQMKSLEKFRTIIERNTRKVESTESTHSG